MASKQSTIQLIYESVVKGQQAVEKLLENQEKLGVTQKAAAAASKKAELEATRLATAQSRAAQAATKAKAEVSKLAATQARAASAVARQVTNEERARAAKIRAEVETRRLAAAETKAARDALKLAQSQNRVATSTAKAGKQAGQSSVNFSKLTRRVTALAAAYVSLHTAQAAVDTGFTSVRTIDQAEQAFLALEQGDRSTASSEFDFLRNEANRLGVDLRKITPEYVKIKAAGEAALFQTSKIKDIFSATAETAVVLGLSGDDLHGTLRAIQQMMSKGTVQAEELRGQLGERLPGAFGLAARAMGVSTQELGKMLENGEVLSSELLPKLAVVLRETFGGQLEEATQTAVRQFERMKTTSFLLTEQFSRPIADNLSPIVRDLNTELNSFLDTGHLEEIGQRVGAFMTLFVEQWQAGRVDELIALTIEAGFETAAEGASERFSNLFNVESFVGFTVALNTAIVNSLVRLAGTVTEILGGIWLKLQVEGQNAFSNLNNFLGELLQDTLEFFAEKLQNLINLAIGAAKLLNLPGADEFKAIDITGKVSFTPTPLKDELTLQEAINKVSERTLGVEESLIRAREILLEKVKSFIGIKSEGDAREISAAEELLKLLDQVIDKNAEIAAAAAAKRAAREPQSNTLATDTVLPPGFGEQFETGFFNAADAIVEKLGSVAEQSQRMFAGIFSSITNEGAAAFEGLLGNTDYWVEKLGAAGNLVGILTSAVSKFFAEWIASQILQSTIFKAKQATDTAVAVTTASILAAAWTPAAVAASIATYGSASTNGLIAYANAQQAASLLNLATPGFAEGIVGVNGPGSATSDSILARISAGESVITARGTELNEPFLRHANNGGRIGDLVGGAANTKEIFVVSTFAEAEALRASIPGRVEISQIADERIARNN